MSRRIRKIKKNNTQSIYLHEILKHDNLMTKDKKINIISKNKAISFKNNISEDPVYLMSQFFIHSEEERRKEITFCLKKNIELLGKIILLNERIYSPEEMDLTQEEYDKVDQIVVVERLTYKIFLDNVKKLNIQGYFVLANLDIFFDSTLFNVKKSTLSIERSLFALSRTEHNPLNGNKEEFMRADSQDSWILHSKYLDFETKDFNIRLGVAGCDNKIPLFFHKKEFKIYNCPYLVKSYHNHRSRERNRTDKTKIMPPYFSPMPVKEFIIYENLIEKSLGTRGFKDHITEDGIADWCQRQDGIMYTRKYNNIRNCNLNAKYCCLTGNSRAFGVFSKYIINKLKNDIVLILIESDVISIPGNILECSKIKKIFTWNKEKPNEKVICLPIGLNKDRQLSQITDTPEEIEKDKLVLINFDVNSHPVRRRLLENKEIMKLSENIDYMPPEKVYNIFTNTGGNIPVQVTNKNYYREMSRFKFVISPRGGGEDCHRTWEALYLGSIPIVLSSSINEIYQDLPVIVVDDWNILTKEFLEKKWEEFKEKEWNWKKLNLRYWIEQFEKY